MKPEDRKVLMEMAEAWEAMAREAERIEQKNDSNK
jgi:hypothetical protein